MASRGQSRSRADLQKSSSTVMHGLEDAGSAVQRMAVDGIETVRDSASDYLELGRDKARELSEELETHVREQPAKSLLIAAAAGFLFGVYFMRR
jgi:ElaB/YqjD/DUF883 family membrane-anchored ribosome-binding protein